MALVIVDYLQLMSGRGRFENRNQEVSALSRGMKLLAKEMNVPMVVLSQLSRAVETGRAITGRSSATCAESGSIEQDADWWASSSAKKSYNRDREDLEARRVDQSPSSATARWARSTWCSCTPRPNSRTAPKDTGDQSEVELTAPSGRGSHRATSLPAVPRGRTRRCGNPWPRNVL